MTKEELQQIKECAEQDLREPSSDWDAIQNTRILKLVTALEEAWKYDVRQTGEIKYIIDHRLPKPQEYDMGEIIPFDKDFKW